MIPPMTTSSPKEASAIASEVCHSERTAGIEDGCGVDSAEDPMKLTSGLIAEVISPANHPVTALVT